LDCLRSLDELLCGKASTLCWRNTTAYCVEAAKKSLFLKDNAKEAVSLAKDASEQVDALIEKMKPLV